MDHIYIFDNEQQATEAQLSRSTHRTIYVIFDMSKSHDRNEITGMRMLQGLLTDHINHVKHRFHKSIIFEKKYAGWMVRSVELAGLGQQKALVVKNIQGFRPVGHGQFV